MTTSVTPEEEQVINSNTFQIVLAIRDSEGMKLDRIFECAASRKTITEAGLRNIYRRIRRNAEDHETLIAFVYEMMHFYLENKQADGA